MGQNYAYAKDNILYSFVYIRIRVVVHVHYTDIKLLDLVKKNVRLISVVEPDPPFFGGSGSDAGIGYTLKNTLLYCITNWTTTEFKSTCFTDKHPDA